MAWLAEEYWKSCGIRATSQGPATESPAVNETDAQIGPLQSRPTKIKTLRLALPMLHIIWYIILGFIAGLIARLILHTHIDILFTILLGIAGSIVGGLIARLFSRPRDGALFHPAGLILSIIGALIVLYVFNKVGPHYHWNQLLH